MSAPGGGGDDPSHRAVLLLAGRRDASLAARLLGEAGLPVATAGDVASLPALLDAGAGILVAAEECLAHADLQPIEAWVAAQPAWSDLPVVVLTLRGGGPERNPSLARLPALLGNVTFVERPFHPATLANAARSALRGRGRQYEGRARLEALAAAETALRAANSTLERRVAERTAELLDAEVRLAHVRRMEALGQLAGGVAHDFNNVLQAVQSGAALLEHRADDAGAVRRIAQLLAEASARGAAVTRRLLAFARRGELRTEAVDAAVLLESMREMLAHTLGPEVAVRIACLGTSSGGLPPMLADKPQLETVLVNLASNARDAMGSGGGTLTLSAALERLGPGGPAPAGAHLRLDVADTGSGMPPEVLARAAEPFFTTKSPGKGTGLGLAMAKGFAEQSGGGFRVSSRPGQGTTVTLWLPVAKGGAAGAAAEPTPAAAAAPVPPGRLVLLVDDDKLVRDVTAEGLRAAGWAVVAAADGTEALALLDGGARFDALLTDLPMPGMSGVALIREARRRVPALPALLLTGHAGEAEALAAEGMFALHRKPAVPRALSERLGELVGAPAG